VTAVETFLKRHWARLELDRYGATDQCTCLVKTPRFRTSNHVIFLVFVAGASEPTLVAKVPRIESHVDAMDKEATNLQAVQALRRGGFDSMPRLVAYERHANWPLLLETAVPGRIMKPAVVRRRPQACLDSVLAWLSDLHMTHAGKSADTQNSWRRRMEESTCGLSDGLDLSEDEWRLVRQTREFAFALRDSTIPLVFEHGDLSSPNILERKDGRVGVLDWELADPEGLPAVDLFFFLNYVAIARSQPREPGEFVAAFRAAFFGKTAWARPYVRRYAESLRLSAEALRSLFVLCWARYIHRLARRMNAGRGSHDSNRARGAMPWLRSNRYWHLWRYAVEHVGELNLFI
jgi:aminoglycoside phosphotransferase (APT) family kinase protein